MKYAVLDDEEHFSSWIKRFSTACESKKFSDFFGYAVALTGIVARNVQDVDKGLDEILAGHHRLAKKGDWYAESEDGLLSVGAIAIANLSRFRGMSTCSAEPLLPEDLLITLQAEPSL